MSLGVEHAVGSSPGGCQHAFLRVLAQFDLARDVHQAKVPAAPATALHGQRVLAAVEADDAAGRLLALLLVPGLPVLLLAILVAVKGSR